MVDVLLIADDPLARRLLEQMLRAHHVVASISSDDMGDDVCDVVVWDMGLHPGDVADLLDELDHPVIALVDDVGLARELLPEVVGLLPRGVEAEQLVSAVEACKHDLVVVDPELLAAALSPAVLEGSEALTPRERQVLALLAEGFSNRLIAETLDISEHTAKFHVQAILQKLEVSTRTEAVVEAMRKGWLMI